jgi:DNA-binding transcriptional MerR regulator
MKTERSDALELTYPLRTAARLTGLSPALLRAWERRYGVVEPIRTPGGTRRYSGADLEKLRLVKAAVDAGHRISQVAQMDLAELQRRAETPEAPATGQQDEILAALDRLDAAEAQRLLSIQLSTLGAVRFARECALPLVREIGERWANERMGIASEHLATGVLRAMLGAALLPSAAAQLGPRIVFATPSGERHELGLQMAALTAMGAGANPVFLGGELPVEDMLGAVESTGAAALALSIVTLPLPQAARAIGAIRGGLPRDVHLWIGGAAASGIEPIEGIERIESLEQLERRVALLGFESATAS